MNFVFKFLVEFSQTHSPPGHPPLLLGSAQHPSGLQDLDIEGVLRESLSLKSLKNLFHLHKRLLNPVVQDCHKTSIWSERTWFLLKTMVTMCVHLFLTPPRWQENWTEHPDQASHSPQMPSTSWTANRTKSRVKDLEMMMNHHWWYNMVLIFGWQ